jgi:hypothetical protein
MTLGSRQMWIIHFYIRPRHPSAAGPAFAPVRPPFHRSPADR